MENITDEEVRAYLLKHHSEEKVNRFLAKNYVEFILLEDEEAGEYMFTFGTDMVDDLFNLDYFKYMYDNLVGNNDLIVYSTREDRDRALAEAVEFMENNGITVFVKNKKK